MDNLSICPECQTTFTQKRKGHIYCSLRCWQRGNSERLNAKRRDAYKNNPEIRKKTAQRHKTWYFTKGGRQKRIAYQRFYRKNRFSILAGLPMNLQTCIVNGQERVIDALKLEYAIAYGLVNK